MDERGSRYRGLLCQSGHYGDGEAALAGPHGVATRILPDDVRRHGAAQALTSLATPALDYVSLARLRRDGTARHDSGGMRRRAADVYSYPWAVVDRGTRV